MSKGWSCPRARDAGKIVYIKVTLRGILYHWKKKKDKMLEPDLDLEGIWEFGKA